VNVAVAVPEPKYVTAPLAVALKLAFAEASAGSKALPVALAVNVAWALPSAGR